MTPEVAYLFSLDAVRERSSIVYNAAKEHRLNNFDFHEDKLNDVADYVTKIIERDFGPSNYDTIPPHGRWQHFEIGGHPRVTQLVQQWKHAALDAKECTRRLLDLFFVSVLLDAGAGDTWGFTEERTGERYGRSEGIAVASLYMFMQNDFSSSNGLVVDSEGLQAITAEKLGAGFQVSDGNQIVGLEPRAKLLKTLGQSLKSLPEIFGKEGRPGNLVDYLLNSVEGSKSLDVKILWDVLQKLLVPIWPKDRCSIGTGEDAIALGDAWRLKLFQGALDGPDAIQPFHKLTQWLTYSLMVPFVNQLEVQWTNTNLLTGLPEYRNGGLFVDKGVLTLKPSELTRGLNTPGASDGLPIFSQDDDVIIEWRAMTVKLLDILYEMILERLRKDDSTIYLSMAQVLEAGTWKAGRQIAAELRPATRSSPLLIASDGTLF
ncbi:DUF1688 domain-containing protein [Bisporella sp. PMI_857]|nr:DUF1688 domain-containing protein [Bisporella sp. PMI_857]